MSPDPGLPALILDVDGTLVDTNYQHTVAWGRALRAVGHPVVLAEVHRHMGMGGDQLVAALIGEEADREVGEEARRIEGEQWSELIREAAPLPGAREAAATLAGLGHTVVLASSAKEQEVEHYIGLLGAQEWAHAWTTAADVAATKPQPDVVEAALGRAGTRHALMVGDTVWDVEAAARAGISCIGVLTGGVGEQELVHAGALTVLRSIAELPAALAGGLVQSRPQASPRLAAPGSV